MEFESAAHAADVVVRSVVTLKNIRACKLAGDHGCLEKYVSVGMLYVFV